MTLSQLVQQIIIEAASIRFKWGVASEVAIRYALANILMTLITGKSAPPIISGFRSIKRQRALLKAFKSGKPERIEGSDEYVDPPPFKPSRKSYHTTGYAIDVDSSFVTPSTLGIFTSIWTALPYGNAGLYFDSPDPGHFDVRVPILSTPKEI